jgi:hypothetical protein
LERIHARQRIPSVDSLFAARLVLVPYAIADDQRPAEKYIDSFAVRKSIQGQIHEIMF